MRLSSTIEHNEARTKRTRYRVGQLARPSKNSPFQYGADQKRFKVLLSIKETAEFGKIPINRLSTSRRMIDSEPDEIVLMLRALRNATLFLQNSARLRPESVVKFLKLDAGRRAVLCSLARAVYPDLTIPRSVADE